MRLISIVLLFVLLTGCNTKPDEGPIDKHRSTINFDKQRQNSFANIVAVAACTRPDGQQYRTEIHSDSSGYTFFRQDFSQDRKYWAIVLNDSTGYTVDSLFANTGELSPITILILKSHEFHKIVMFPEEFFVLTTAGDQDEFGGRMCTPVRAYDKAGNPATLYFAIADGRLEGFEMQNPTNAGETIRITHTAWKNYDSLLLPEALSIRQGETAVYTFRFTDVRLNDPHFQRLSGALR